VLPVRRLGDEGEAVAYHSEAFAADHTNLETVSWLGAHYVRRQDYLAAVPYFEAASRVQPREVRLSVLVGHVGQGSAALGLAVQGPQR
jgi:intraflagellar transport protein 88